MSTKIEASRQLQVHGDVDWGAHRITNLADPSSAQDAVTRAWLVANTQPLDSDLTAIAAISTPGLVAHTGSGTAAARTITGTTDQITVTDGDGAAGNPTISLSSTLVLPSGTTGTTQTAGDDSTKLATTAYADAGDAATLTAAAAYTDAAVAAGGGGGMVYDLGTW